METKRLAEYLDRYLNVAAIGDYKNALNGLQVENSGRVGRVAVAVDASAASIAQAVQLGCGMLLVHHGLFWDGQLPLTGRRYQRVKALLEGDVALYSAHLPLDVHPEVGNNVVLARALGIEVEGTFGVHEGGMGAGVHGRVDLTREALTARLDDLLGVRVKLLAGGPEKIERVGVITGGAGSMIGAAIEAGLDAFVTGEGAHHTYFDAMEGGINVYYGGHYATETWGVRALAEHIEREHGLAWVFIDQPTGL